jgi:hypothetical protein
MPYSGDLINEDILSFFNYIKSDVNTILDVGVGAGKFGTMWGEHVNPHVDMQGIEICGPYFKRFHDTYVKYYSEVHNEDITSCFNRPEIKFDLVIFGDVLEHLRRSEALDVLDFFIYRCKYMLCVFPIRAPQNPADVEGYFHEAHISSLCVEDFDHLNTPYTVRQHLPQVGVFLNGYPLYQYDVKTW